MTGYINWMQLNQPISGEKMQMQGNCVSDHEAIASGAPSNTAPTGTHYAAVWSENAATFRADGLGVGNEAEGRTVAMPAGAVFEIPNIIPKKTTITITDL